MKTLGWSDEEVVIDVYHITYNEDDEYLQKWDVARSSHNDQTPVCLRSVQALARERER